MLSGKNNKLVLNFILSYLEKQKTFLFFITTDNENAPRCNSHCRRKGFTLNSKEAHAFDYNTQFSGKTNDF